MVPPRIFLVALFTLAAAAATAQTPPADPQQRLPGLIQQLGSEKYAERRAAQREIAAIGLAAFDQLYAARDHADPEIAATAQRLLSQMTIRWSQPGDSPAVRGQLELYSRLDPAERSDVVEQLAKLPAGQGLSALCRIARFDLSPGVAALAATGIMSVTDLQDVPRGKDPAGLRATPESQAAVAACLKELDELYGRSNRQTARWLTLFSQQNLNPALSAQQWSEELGRLRGLAERNDSAVERPVLAALGWNLLRVQLLAGQQDRAAQTVQQLAEDVPQQTPAVLRQALAWMLAADTQESIDQVLSMTTDNDYLHTQRGLYLAAKTRLRQGRQELAEQLAQQAFESEPGPQEVLGRRGGQPVLDGRVVVGLRLRDEGYPAWARRELRKAMTDEQELSASSAYATWALADSLQDDAQYQQASDVLQGFLAKINADPAAKNAYRRMVEGRDELFQPLNAVIASEAYYRALASRAAGDPQAEQAALLEAVEKDPKNADILIAMYRANPPEHPLRKDALKRIAKLAESFEELIDQDPTDATPYNQWAWLIANTEGDYQRAVRYSLRSLDLSPGNAGYLDTLGRCYYATGDLPKAIESQQQAIRREPQFKVMQRQLEFFQQELAKQKS